MKRKIVSRCVFSERLVWNIQRNHHHHLSLPVLLQGGERGVFTRVSTWSLAFLSVVFARNATLKKTNNVCPTSYFSHVLKP